MEVAVIERSRTLSYSPEDNHEAAAVIKKNGTLSYSPGEKKRKEPETANEVYITSLWRRCLCVCGNLSVRNDAPGVPTFAQLSYRIWGHLYTGYQDLVRHFPCSRPPALPTRRLSPSRPAS